MLVDSHCHLDYPQFQEDVSAVVARAEAAGVRRLLTINTRLSTYERVRVLAERHESVFMATGVHPHQAGEEGPAAPDPLIAQAEHCKVVAIGEAGLDYHYDKSPREAQAHAFRQHIRAAQTTGLPLIVHTRNADEDTVAILEEGLADAHFSCVIHCYSSSHWLGMRAVDLGFYLGIGGILTFNRSTELRESVRLMPRDRILLETDSPYLAPVPKRGQTNEPAYVVHVAKALAAVWQSEIAEVERVTTDNFFRLFGKVTRPL